MKQSHRYKELQLVQLRSFCFAATEGNFTAAASALGLSASTVWQQVRSLERELKATLLHRRGRSVELTDEGRLVLELVQPHVTSLDSLRAIFDSRRSELRRELSVASGAYLFAHHLAAPIQQFRAERPLLQLNLRIANWSGLARLMDRGEADVAVMACDPDVPRSPRLEYDHLFDEDLMLMTPTGHPLAKAKRISPEELIKYPLIIPPKGGGDRRVIDRVLRKHNLTSRVHTAMESGLVDITRKYVALGVGVALMYMARDVAQSMSDLHIRPFDPKMERLQIEIAVRKGTHLPDDVQEFRRIVRQHLSESDGNGREK